MKLALKVATPALNWTLPITTAPSIKVTRPVELKPVTVAVRITNSPGLAGLGVALSVVVDATLFTARFTAAEVLVVLIGSPLYTAVSVRGPSTMKLALKVATPALN